MAEGLAVLAVGASLMAWTLTPPSTGVGMFDDHSPLARAVVQAVRDSKWGIAATTHDWTAARADGGIVLGAVREHEEGLTGAGRDSVAPVGSLRQGTARLHVTAPPALIAEGMIRPARRLVEADVVQKCTSLGCSPARVVAVRFEGETIKERLVPEGSIRQELLEKGRERYGDKLKALKERFLN